MLGKVDEHEAILLVQRAAFSKDEDVLRDVTKSLAKVSNLSGNDIYAWYLGWSGSGVNNGSAKPHDLKLDLICPCTAKHVAKYSAQGVRTVAETPEIYRQYVRPYMRLQREAGRLNWVFNILEGRTEQEDVMLRSQGDTSNTVSGEDEGFLLMPDLNWDRKTIDALHLLVLVERRDIWSVRDLTKRHVPWLQSMRRKVLKATAELFPKVEPDQLKLYVHYQPTYYHFHVHVVHVMLEAGATQAVGKAFGLENIVSQLEMMPGEDMGMDALSLTYSLGESNELWKDLFEPLKHGRSSSILERG